MKNWPYMDKEFKAMDEITDVFLKYEIEDKDAVGILYSMLKTLHQMKILGLKNIFKNKGEPYVKQRKDN